MNERSPHHLRREGSVDVAIVGGGIMGLAACWQIASRGHRTVLCEQYGHDHKHGSSHGTSRIFRLAYEEEDYVELAQRAVSDWRALESATHATLLTQVGGFDLGRESDLTPIAQSLRSAGASVDELTREQITAEFGDVALPDDFVGLLQPDAGIIAAHDALEALIHLSREAGAEVCFNRRVLSVIDETDHVVLETDEGSLRAQLVIVCGGGWTNSILRPMNLRVPIAVTREHVAYYRVTTKLSARPFIWHNPSGPEVYGLPRRAGDHIFKVGLHLAGPEIELEHHAHSEPDHDLIQSITDFVGKHFPGLHRHALLPETCLYASTPDNDFVIERHNSIVLGCGFGGHGFKFGPTVGALLADLVEGKEAPYAPRFASERFAAVGP